MLNLKTVQFSELLELKEEQRKLKAELTRWKNKSETAQQELRTEKQVEKIVS